VPVRPGRDMGSILEIAARNELLRRAGNDSAKEFLERLNSRLGVVDKSLTAYDAEPESMCPPPIDALESSAGNSPPPSEPDPHGESAAWPISGGRHLKANESSAWIPAVRPKPEDD